MATLRNPEDNLKNITALAFVIDSKKEVKIGLGEYFSKK
jgi:hypothetical protein